MSEFSKYLHRTRDAAGSLTRQEAAAALRAILDGQATDQEIADLLTAMARRGETVAELTGFAETMRSFATVIPLSQQERDALVDTCGTGGDGHGTFNISTAAALVAAAAGAKVAKHGNRAVTSKCGSADVLEALGVPIDLPIPLAVESLRATGFMFLLAPVMHPAMKRVGPVRRSLGFRTIFNLAGPLTNPAGAKAQVVGVYAANCIPVVAETMANLGTRHGFVVYGLDGLDELSLSGETMVAEVRPPDSDSPQITGNAPGHGRNIRHYRFDPRQFGLPLAPLDQLQGGETAAENAAILEAILYGETGPKRDIVLLNAAAALVVSGIASDIQNGIQIGAETIDSGATRVTLAALREFGKMTATER